MQATITLADRRDAPPPAPITLHHRIERRTRFLFGTYRPNLPTPSLFLDLPHDGNVLSFGTRHRAIYLTRYPRRTR